jgi:hypothetical protein
MAAVGCSCAPLTPNILAGDLYNAIPSHTILQRLERLTCEITMPSRTGIRIRGARQTVHVTRNWPSSAPTRQTAAAVLHPQSLDGKKFPDQLYSLF